MFVVTRCFLPDIVAEYEKHLVSKVYSMLDTCHRLACMFLKLKQQIHPCMIKAFERTMHYLKNIVCRYFGNILSMRKEKGKYTKTYNSSVERFAYYYSK